MKVYCSQCKHSSMGDCWNKKNLVSTPLCSSAINMSRGSREREEINHDNNCSWFEMKLFWRMWYWMGHERKIGIRKMTPKFEVGNIVRWKVLGGYCIGRISCIVVLKDSCLYQVPNCWLKKKEDELERVCKCCSVPLTEENKPSGK